MFNNAKVCLLCGSKMPCWDKKCKKGNERRGFRHQIRQQSPIWAQWKFSGDKHKSLQVDTERTFHQRCPLVML